MRKEYKDNYKMLLEEAKENNILVKEVFLKSNCDELYKDSKIALNKKRLKTDKEKACVLAEELGHHYTTVGNILDLDNIDNAMQELEARYFAFKKLASIEHLVEAFSNDLRNISEIAEYLNVTDSFLREAINCYRLNTGRKTIECNGYYIKFIPNLVIFKKIDNEV